MGDADARIEVASYRDVFDLERRIYRIDRLRLNPGGLPLRGAIYFAAAILAAAALGGLPVVGWALGAVPWYLRYVALPALLAALAGTARIEGRPLHLALRGLLLQRLRSRQLSGFATTHALGTRWHPPPIVVVPDGVGAHPRRFRFTGPGTVVVRCPHECVAWRSIGGRRLLGGPDLTLRLRPGPPTAGRALALGVDVRLDVTSHPRSALRVD